MYQIFCDNILIGDSRVEELCVNQPIARLEVNTSGWFSFTFPATHPYINQINRLTSVIRVERDGELVFQGFCTSTKDDILGNRTVSCEGEMSYLNDSVLRPHKYQIQSSNAVRDLLYAYIAEHNAQVEERKRFVLGRVTVTDPNNYIFCYTNNNSTMQEIKEDLIDDYGGYLFIRYEDGVKYIDYLAEPENNAQQTIELGKNLITYQSNIDDTQIATRVIPLGGLLDTEVIEGLPARLDIKSVNGGSDYLENQSAVANFGIITKVVIWDDVTVAENLKAKGAQWLIDNQFENVTVSATAFDLSMIDTEFQQFKLFDKVRVVSDYHGMDKWFMLSATSINLASPENDVYTLGKNVYNSLTIKSNNISAGVAKVVEETAGMEGNWLKKAKQQASDLLSGVDGGYVVFNIDEETGEPFEILVMDTDNKDTATKVWRWNQNGFGYSDTGYHGTYGTAITMNGEIVADYIKAGTIQGITITGNTINGGTINGTEFNASGVVKRYRSDYSQSDVNRVASIVLGATQPTDADYEKLDMDSDGIIDSRDSVIIRKLINGDYGDYYELQCPVTLNGTNQFGKIKTNRVRIHNDGITSENLNINNTLIIKGFSTSNSVSVKIRDGSQEWTGSTGDYQNVRGFRVVNGLVVNVYT